VPSAFAHAGAALALGPAVRHHPRRRLLWTLGALSAVFPDADVLAFALGIPYEHVLGHRGLSHALLFAAGWSGALTWLFFRADPLRRRIALFLFGCTASHGLLDMLTDGGHGVALLAPVYNARLFFPFRPVEVSPLGVGRFFSERGLEVLASEALWIGVPALAVAGVLMLWSRSDSPSAPSHA
jgi:inner membrane protein